MSMVWMPANRDDELEQRLQRLYDVVTETARTSYFWPRRHHP